MRTAASAGLSALRIIEDEAARGRGERILLRAGRDAAVYVLNKKRSELAEIEHRYGVMIEIAIDESFEGARMTVESSGPRPVPAQPSAPVIESPEEEEEEEEEERAEAQEERGGRRRRRRRRGGRGRRRGGGQEGGLPADELPPSVEETGASEAPVEEIAEAEAAPETEGEARPKRSRRRRKPRAAAEGEAPEVEADSSPMVVRPTDEEPPITATEAPAEVEPAVKPKRSRRKKAEPKEEAAPAPVEAAEEAPAEKPKRRSKAKPKEEAAEAAPVPSADNDPNGGGDEAGKRSGWWQRTFG
jgi:ribonuclease E